MVWYLDADLDTYGVDDVTPDVTFLSTDLDCLCQSDCGSSNPCYSYDNTGTISGTCVPGSCLDYAAQLFTQCSNPIDDNNLHVLGLSADNISDTDPDISLSSQWVTRQGDCDDQSQTTTMTVSLMAR